MYAVLAAFLAYMSPYNASTGLGYPLAFAYWLAMMLTGGISGGLCMVVYQRFAPRVHIYATLVIGALTSAVAVTAFIALVETVFRQGIPLAYLPTVYGSVLVISIGVTLINYLVERAYTPVPEPTTDRAAHNRFLDRLPIKYRTAQLYAIMSEDHYLRVITDLGDTMILMRLSDAEQELAHTDGIRVHRSWWIARAGINDVKKTNGRVFLTLPSGESVPVSRTYRGAAKEKGYLT